MGSLETIPLAKLAVSAKNVRQDLADHDDTSVEDLAADIAAHGLMHPLTVRAHGVGYEIIAGQRRYLALKHLGREAAPCRVIVLDDLAAEEMSLTENTQRAQLTTADKVRSYSRLYEVYDHSMSRLAKAVSLKPATLAKYIKIAALPDEVLTRLDAKGDGRLTLTTAAALANVPADRVAEVAAAITILPTDLQRVSAARKIVGEIAERMLDDEVVSAEDMSRIADRFLIDDLEERERLCECGHPPWVPGRTGGKVEIPPALYEAILDLIEE